MEGDDYAKLGKQIPKRTSVWDYVSSELTRGYLLERGETKYTERRQRVYTFMTTPRELEKFCMNGFFHCTDAFLFLFTFLPLRIFLAMVRIFTCPFGLISSRSGNILEPAQKCDLLKGIIIISCCCIINYIDTSMMYHLVRGQAVIKLYVFFNMLEVCDKLFSSFGQDILDALFWTATEPKGRRREQVGVIPHLVLAIVYVIIHSLLLLFQVTVLNVAFNSHNKALLTIMVSNNFVEIKGSLFRKMDEKNLFQISCSDVKERFHYIILLSVVFIRNMTEFSWNLDHVWVILPDAAIILLAELIVDWVKHAFITKFNEIPAEVYRRFTANLAEDLLQSRQKHAFTDHSDLVSRRMNFTPIPLAVLLWRVLSRSLKISGYLPVLSCCLFYLCLFTTKILVSIIMIGRACKYSSQSSTTDVKQRENVEAECSESSDTVHTTQPDLIREHTCSTGSVECGFIDLSEVYEKEELDDETDQSFYESDSVSISTEKIIENKISAETLSSASATTPTKYSPDEAIVLHDDKVHYVDKLDEDSLVKEDEETLEFSSDGCHVFDISAVNLNEKKNV